MLSNLTAKLALKKVGLDSNTLDNIATSVTAAAPAWLTGAGPASPTTERPAPGKRNGTRTTSAPAGSLPGLDEDGTRTGTGGGTGSNGTNWPSWMSVKALPLTVQPWFSPPPPPIPVAPECPRVGDVAPMDRDRKITVGGGKKVVVVFLRCVGCACM